MDEGAVEPPGYVRMSAPVAAYAFTILPSGVTMLNLRWLSEIMHEYEARGQRLADVPSEREQLELIRTIADQVDDDRLAWFMRQRRPG